MPRTMIALLTLLSVGSTIRADDEPKPALSPAEQFKVLVDKFEQDGQPREIAGKFLELARKHPKDPVAVDALVWIVSNVRRGSELSRALPMLTKDHIKSEKLAPICRKLVRRPSLATERLLRGALKRSPHKSVRAQACFHLAAYLKRQVSLMKSLKEQPDRRRFEQFYGKGFTKHLASLKEDRVSKEIEKLYEQVAKSFADVRTTGGAMGQTAKKELFAIRHLSVGRPAPEIKGEDIDGQVFKLSDYRGKVIVLDFWGHW